MFLFIIARNTLKSDYKIKMCFPEAPYGLLLSYIANYYYLTY